MKHLFKSIVCLMLVASAAAQAQDAFYVYQNDGHFDGFFYDEVEKIRYSKLDTLGFEHEVYVSQEIVTADSTYRFMLTAIDSIGFVQPEIKYNPNVRRVREEGILDYVGYHDEENMRLYFYGTTPEDKLPHVGDVLLDFDLEEGFCGKVTEVDDGGLSIIVRYAPLESMREVFQRFVCVEQYDHNSQGELVRSRVAGMPQLTRGNWDKSMAKARDDFDFSLFDINFNGHLPVGFEENFSMAVDINAHVAMRLKGSYNISYLDPIYIGLLFTSDVSLGMGVTIDGELKKIIESSTDFIPGIPIPAAAPIFELRNIPGLFARGDIHLKFSANLVNIPLSQVWHKIEFNDDWLPSLSFGKSKKTLAEQKEEAGSASPSAYMEFNGYLQTGVHAPLTLSTNRWLSKICKAEFGTHLYIGPKLSGNLQVDFTEIMKQGVSFYNAHKNSALKLTPLSVDFETKATMSGWWGKEKEVTFGDGSITVIRDYGLYLFPEFDRWNEVKDPHDSKGNVLEGQFAGIFCKNRNTIFPYQIGIRVFRKYSDKEYEPIGDIWEDREYRTGSTWNYGEKWLESENMLDHPHFNLDYLGSAGGGEVRLRPIFRCGSFVLEGSPDYECWAGEYFRAEKDEVEIPCEIGEEICVGIDTNMKIGSVSDLQLGSDSKYLDALESEESSMLDNFAFNHYKARYNKVSDDGGVLCITNLMHNPDPFRKYVMRYSSLEPEQSNQNGIVMTPPLTIVQAENENPLVVSFQVNGNKYNENGEVLESTHGAFVDYRNMTEPIKLSGGSFSYSYTEKTDNYGNTYTTTISGTLSPDETKGWGFFQISGSYSTKGVVQYDQSGATLESWTDNGTFNGDVQLGSRFWVDEADNSIRWGIGNTDKCTVNGTKTITRTAGIGTYTTTTTCTEGSVYMTFVIPRKSQ